MRLNMLIFISTDFFCCNYITIYLLIIFWLSIKNMKKKKFLESMKLFHKDNFVI